MYKIHPVGFITYLRHSSTVEWVTTLLKYFQSWFYTLLSFKNIHKVNDKMIRIVFFMMDKSDSVCGKIPGLAVMSGEHAAGNRISDYHFVLRIPQNFFIGYS